MSEHDAGRFERLAEILDGAVALRAEQRTRYLDVACGGDVALRDDVESMIAAHERRGPLDELRPAIPETLRSAIGAPALPRFVGSFEVISLIGSGGMGDVYRARRVSDGFEQKVALKVLRPGAADHAMLQRFLDERRILATLEHAGVTRFIDGGITGDGTPYIAMEIVQGVPIVRYCREHRATLTERVKLVIAVCEAIHYAHQHLIVHRDIKPSNILVTDAGSVKVLDFGIAKMLEAHDASATATGQRWMTLDYASPEQVRGDAVTTAVDVFAIGVVLYELLTGQKPHSGATRQEVEQRILDQDPAPPSTTLDGIDAEQFGTTRRALQREMSGDLDTIVLKALAKEPARRFLSVAELADDLQRFLGGLPVRARPDSASYRARKFIRRHRRLVIAVSTGLVGVLAGGATAAVSLRRTQLTAEREARERARAEAVTRFVVGLFGGLDPLRVGRDSTGRELLDSGAARVRREFAGDAATRSALFDQLSITYESLGRIPEAVDMNLESIGALRGVSEPDSSALARALATRARLLILTGSVDSARAVAQAAVRMGRRHNERGRAAEHLRVLGTAFAAAGRLDSAARYLDLALEAGRGDTSFAFRDAVLDDRASLHAHRGNLTALEAVFDSMIVLRTRRFGASHPQVAMLLGQRGETRLRIGKLREAQADLDSGHQMLAATVGEQHPYVATMHFHAGRVALRLGDATGAETHFGEAASIMGALYGTESQYRARPLAGLGEARLALGRARNAIDPLREAVEIWRRAPKPPSSSIAMALNLLGNALRESGEPNRGEALHREAYQLLTARGSGGDSAVAVVRADFALTLSALGRRAEAEPHAAAALTALTRFPAETLRVRRLVSLQRR